MIEDSFEESSAQEAPDYSFNDGFIKGHLHPPAAGSGKGGINLFQLTVRTPSGEGGLGHGYSDTFKIERDWGELPDRLVKSHRRAFREGALAMLHALRDYMGEVPEEIIPNPARPKLGRGR